MLRSFRQNLQPGPAPPGSTPPPLPPNQERNLAARLFISERRRRDASVATCAIVGWRVDCRLAVAPNSDLVVSTCSVRLHHFEMREPISVVARSRSRCPVTPGSLAFCPRPGPLDAEYLREGIIVTQRDSTSKPAPRSRTTKHVARPSSTTCRPTHRNLERIPVPPPNAPPSKNSPPAPDLAPAIQSRRGEPPAVHPPGQPHRMRPRRHRRNELSDCDLVARRSFSRCAGAHAGRRSRPPRAATGGLAWLRRDGFRYGPEIPRYRHAGSSGFAHD